MRLRSFRSSLALLTLLLCGAQALAAPARTIVLVGTTGTRQSVHGPWLELIYREAFRRLGYGFSYQAYPSMRASAMADAGQVDGEIHRVHDYAGEHPHLIRVEQAHFAMRFAAYAARPLPLADGWDSLRNSPYRIEYHAGTAYTTARLSGVVPARQLSSVASVRLGLRKLERGRTDIFIDVADVIDAQLASAEFRSAAAPIRRIARMEDVNGYAYLHSKNQALAGPLAATLAAMKKEGLIEVYRRQASLQQANAAPLAD